MPLRIGFDLDGTVADMYSALQREAEQLFGEELIAKANAKATKEIAPSTDTKNENDTKEEDTTTTLAMEELHLTARQQMQLWDHVKTIDNFWTTLPELEPGIIARIARASTERRWEVIFFTTRPSTAGEMTQLQSQRWLDAHGFHYPSVYVVQRSRGRIAEALHLDVFVDDRPENCLDIAVESKAKVILVWHGLLKDVPPGAKRLGVKAVNTISEALAVLEQYDDHKNGPGVMKSIRRLISREAE